MALFSQTVQAAAAALPAASVTVLPFGLGGDDVLAASGTVTLDYDVNVPDMVRPFRPYQAAAYVAATDAIARWGGAFLGDDMGLGKTQVMLALANARLRNRGGYAIIVAPPVTLAGFQDDLAASFPALRMHHLFGRKADFAGMPAADLYFLNDDPQTMSAWLCNVTEELVKGRRVKVYHANAFAAGASMTIRDEIHRDKGNEGKPTGRAKVMLALGDAARANGTPVVAATGTLLTNRPVEAFIPLTVVGGDALVTAVTPGARRPSGFLFRYCAPVKVHTGGGGVATKFSGVDMDEMANLHEYLRRTVYIRREKSDLPDNTLPHSGWIVKPVALPKVAMQRYYRVETDFLNWLAGEKGTQAALRAKRAETIVRMQSLWQEAAKAKADATIDYVLDLVDQGRKVVVAYIHADVWTALATGLAKAGVDCCSINGQVTGDARSFAITEFQATDGPMVMLAQIKAAGMGVTLTRAADVVFCQTPWSAGDLKQMADRILRGDDISYERAAAGGVVTWHVIQAAYDNGDPTFDMGMWTVLENKAKVCDAVNAGRPVTMDENSVTAAMLEAWYPTARSRWR